MAERRWDRLRRKRRGADERPPEEGYESVLDADEYAWWAARDELETGKVPHGRKRTGDAVGVLDQTDPYVVLGLRTSASWAEITSAHRRLAKLHHPDRLVDAAPDQRESSDRRIRDLNIAYMELRRRKGR